MCFRWLSQQKKKPRSFSPDMEEILPRVRQSLTTVASPVAKPTSTPIRPPRPPLNTLPPKLFASPLHKLDLQDRPSSNTLATFRWPVKILIPRLPLELLYHVLDLILVDAFPTHSAPYIDSKICRTPDPEGRSTVKACSLTCMTFAVYLHRRMFRQFRASSDDSRTKKLFVFKGYNNKISRYITSVRLSQSHAWRTDEIWKPQEMVGHDLRVLEDLAHNLRELILDVGTSDMGKRSMIKWDAVAPGYRFLVAALLRSPISLESLRLIGLRDLPEMLLDRIPSRLEHLQLSYISLSTDTDVFYADMQARAQGDVVIEDLGDVSRGCQLRTLEINHCSDALSYLLSASATYSKRSTLSALETVDIGSSLGHQSEASPLLAFLVSLRLPKLSRIRFSLDQHNTLLPDIPALNFLSSSSGPFRHVEIIRHVFDYVNYKYPGYIASYLEEAALVLDSHDDAFQLETLTITFFFGPLTYYPPATGYALKAILRSSVDWVALDQVLCLPRLSESLKTLVIDTRHFDDSGAQGRGNVVGRGCGAELRRTVKGWLPRVDDLGRCTIDVCV